METQLFDWEDYDIVDTYVFVYYEVTRKSDGEKFDLANVNYEDAILEYIRDGLIIETHRLILTSEIIHDS